MNEDKIIDQSELAESVAKSIPYSFFDFFLVKPLDPIKVKKEVTKPVAESAPKKDENGVEAQDFDNVETEVKEVNSDYRRGVVLKRPLYYEVEDSKNTFIPINIGDIVIFRDAAGLSFDLLKDSKLLRQYDILGVEK